MNKQIKSLINKYCYKLGMNHYEEQRKKMITRATVMARSGMSLHAIISELGIPMSQDQEKEAQEEKNPN